MRTRQDGGSTRQEEVKALLLSYNSAPVWQIGNEIVTGLGADHIRFPELPDSLYSRPTLIWTIENEGAARHRVEASYLASKLSWQADYVFTVARDDKSGDLNGWVTLTNGSGTAFRNATLAAGGGRSESGAAATDARGEGRPTRVAPTWPPPRRWPKNRSPTTTSTPWAGRRRSTTTRPSR